VTLATSGDTDVTATAGSKKSDPPTKITALVAPGVTLTCAVGATANCSSVTAGQTVTFTATRTAGAIVAATLEFGDGSSVELGALNGATSVPHTYSGTGTFTARLTARDANGETTSAVQVVQVLAQAAADVAVSVSGLTVTATAAASAPVSTYQWTFEAGATQTTTSPTATHTYAAAGPKTLTLIVTFVDGRTVTVTRTFTV
jgi:PKD repeat protein